MVTRHLPGLGGLWSHSAQIQSLSVLGDPAQISKALQASFLTPGRWEPQLIPPRSEGFSLKSPMALHCTPVLPTGHLPREALPDHSS